jgi:glycerol-3-phosphate acyltransferase PlsY
LLLSNETLLALVALFVAYALGSIPTAVWVGRIQKGIDIREHGSGNAGLTNAIRVLGWKGAGPVLAVDLLKGFSAPLVAMLITGANRWDLIVIGAGVLGILGHSFTLFAGFRGGKGVLTGLGVFLFLAPIQAILAFAVWSLVVWRTRYVSLGSILACVTLIVTAGVDSALGSLPWGLTAMCTGIGLFVIWKHRANIGRLRAGTENKLGSKSK